MWSAREARAVAGGASAFQMCVLAAFYTVVIPGKSVSHVLAGDDEICIAFTIVFTLLAYVQLLNMGFFFVTYTDPESDVCQSGMSAAFVAAWMLSLTLRYPIGTGQHLTVATLLICSYMLALFMQQYDGLGRTRASICTMALYGAAGVTLVVWLCTRNNRFEWAAWGLLTLVQCMLNLVITPRLEQPAPLWQFSPV